MSPNLDSEDLVNDLQAARERAAEVRKARAELKEQLKQGGITLAKVLERADEDDVVGKLKVSAVLQALPGIGKIRAIQIMEKLKIADSRRLRGLGDQQRRALLAELTSQYQAPPQMSAQPEPRITEPRTPFEDKEISSSGYDLFLVGHRDGLTVVNARPDEHLRKQIAKSPTPPTASLQESDAQVDVYLATDDPAVADRVFVAVDALMLELGYGTPVDTQIHRGSFFRRSRAVRRLMSSTEFMGRLQKVERAIELAQLDKRQAEVDGVQSEAVARLLEVLQEVASACIRSGSVLIIKYDAGQGPVVIARTLSPVEVHTLDRFPEIQTDPRKALEALATAVAHEATPAKETIG